MELSTQNPCNALIKRYGSHLEEMEPEDKLALRALLANFVYLIEIVDRELTLAESFRETIYANDATTFDFNEIIIPTLEGISTRDAEGLIAAITAQLCKAP